MFLEAEERIENTADDDFVSEDEAMKVIGVSEGDLGDTDTGVNKRTTTELEINVRVD